MNMIFSTKKGGLYGNIPKPPQNVIGIQRNTRELGVSNTNTKPFNTGVKTVSLTNTRGLTYGMIHIVESGLKGCGNCRGAK